MPNSRLLPAVLALSMASSACLFRKSPSVFTPPPQRAQPDAKVPAEASTLPAPPDIEGDPSTATPPAVSTTIPRAPEPPPPKPPVQRAPVATSPPKVVTPPSAQGPEAPAPPKIGQIFTPEQSRLYNRELDESLDRVRKVLGAVAGKTLNAEQNEIANRIRTFQKQAEQAREQDLVTAVSFARRADLLAQDLAGRLP